MPEEYNLPTLYENNITLCPWKTEYACEMLPFASGAQIENMRGWKPILTEQKAREKIRSFYRRKEFEWAIRYCNGEVWKSVGSIGLRRSKLISRCGTCMEIGHIISAEYRERGIDSTAIRLATDYALKTLRCDAVCAVCAADDMYMKRIFESHSFTCDGIFSRARQESGAAQARYVITRAE